MAFPKWALLVHQESTFGANASLLLGHFLQIWTYFWADFSTARELGHLPELAKNFQFGDLPIPDQCCVILFISIEVATESTQGTLVSGWQSDCEMTVPAEGDHEAKICLEHSVPTLLVDDNVI